MSDTIKKEVFTVHLTYEISVNIDTGEILETKLINRDVDNSDLRSKPIKKVVQDDSSEPTLVLESNRYRLNEAAINLMGLDYSSKLVIKYEECGSESIPIIGTNTAFGISSGNKLTKSNTVACRGSNHDELSKHGETFIILPHPSRQGLFILSSESESECGLTGDDNIKEEGNEGEDLPFNLSVDELVDDQDANITEIDSNFFQL